MKNIAVFTIVSGVVKRSGHCQSCYRQRLKRISMAQICLGKNRLDLGKKGFRFVE